MLDGATFPHGKEQFWAMLFAAATCYLCHNVCLLVVDTKLQPDRGQADRISLTHNLVLTYDPDR